MLMVVCGSWPAFWAGGNIPSQDMVACLSAEQTVSLRALFLCPVQGLENQELGLLSESCKTVITGLSVHQQNITSLFEEFQLEQLAVETFPVDVSFSLSFLLASSRAAATSMVETELGPG